MLPSASDLESLHFSYQTALDTMNEDESDFCTVWAVHRLRMKPKYRDGQLVSVLRPTTSEIMVTDEPPSISIQEEVSKYHIQIVTEEDMKERVDYTKLILRVWNAT